MDDKVYVEEFKELQHCNGAIVEFLQAKQMNEFTEIKGRNIVKKCF